MQHLKEPDSETHERDFFASRRIRRPLKTCLRSPEGTFDIPYWDDGHPARLDGRPPSVNWQDARCPSLRNGRFAKVNGQFDANGLTRKS